jgi:hypothetical protein
MAIPARSAGAHPEDTFDMTSPRSRAALRLGTLAAALVGAALLSACVVEAPAPRYVQAPPPHPVPVYPQPVPEYAPDNDPVVSVYVDPPIDQPEPIAVQWAPPPMLVEVPPPQPYPGAIWTGGYWAWEGRWFWSAGRWVPPPRPNYYWVQPYYEHRADVVVFVPGFWCAPQARFVPPAPGLSITVAIAAPGVRFGRPPMGPQGIFVPPPPGSRPGLIVPAPLGTPPAVVVSAPPVVNVGMRVRGEIDVNSHNVTNITNVTNVTIEASAGATANGRAYQNSVPARANLAAAMAPAGRPAAPQPVSTQAIPAYRPGRPPMPLPAAEPVRIGGPDRGATVPGSARPAAPPMPAPQFAPPGQPQAAQARPGPGQARPEFDAPPRQPAPINGQPQSGQPQQPGAQPGQPRPGYGQPPQGQPAGQAQQPAAPGQPPQASPQDGRRRGGNPGQPGAQPAAQPGAQPAAQPGAQGQAPAAKTKDDREKEERRKAPRERKEDRDKKDGERDR